MHPVIKKTLFTLLVVFGIFHAGYAMDRDNNNNNSGSVEKFKKQKCRGEYLELSFDNNYNKTDLKKNTFVDAAIT